MAKDKVRLDDFLPAAVVFRDYLSHINKFYEKACSRLNLLKMLKHILDRKNSTNLRVWLYCVGQLFPEKLSPPRKCTCCSRENNYRSSKKLI